MCERDAMEEIGTYRSPHFLSPNHHGSGHLSPNPITAHHATSHPPTHPSNLRPAQQHQQLRATPRRRLSPRSRPPPRPTTSSAPLIAPPAPPKPDSTLIPPIPRPQTPRCPIRRDQIPTLIWFVAAWIDRTNLALMSTFLPLSEDTTHPRSARSRGRAARAGEDGETGRGADVGVKEDSEEGGVCRVVRGALGGGEDDLEGLRGGSHRTVP